MSRENLGINIDMVDPHDLHQSDEERTEFKNAENVDLNERQDTRRVSIKDVELPDYDKLTQYLASVMPQNKQGNKYDVCCEAVCLDVTGKECCTAAKDSEISDWGVGIGLYYRFLKHTTYLFLIIIFLNLFVIAINSRTFWLYASKGMKPNDGTLMTTLKNEQQATSLGGYSMVSNKFFQFPWATADNFKVSCPSATSLITNDSAYSYYGQLGNYFEARKTFSQYDSQCNDQDAFSSALTAASCIGQQSCTLAYSPSWFNTTCMSDKKQDQSETDGTPNYKVYMKLYCKDLEVDVFGIGAQPKSVWSLVIASCGFLILVSFFIYMIVLAKTESKSLDHYYTYQASPLTFSVKIEGTPSDYSEGRLVSELYDHFGKYLSAMTLNKNTVVDIKPVVPNERFHCEEQIYRLNDEKSSVFMKLKKQKYFETSMSSVANSNQIDIEDLKIKINKYIPNINDKEDALDRINDIEKLQVKIDKIKETKKNLTGKEEILHLFVTFEDAPSRNFVLSKMSASSCTVFCLRCCAKGKNDIRIFAGGVITAQIPPQPDNIIWQNLTINAFSKRIRYWISFLFTLVLFCLPIIAILKLKSIFEQYSEDSSIECPESVTQFEAWTDFQLGKQAKGLMICYCTDNLSEKVNEVFTYNGENKKYCYDVYINMAFANLMTFALGAILAVINGLGEIVLKIFNRFEGHKDENDKALAIITRLFQWKYLNTGLLILLLNARTSIGQVGKFDDFTPKWFHELGSSIIFAFFADMLVRIAKLLIIVFAQYFKQCCDRGCRLSMTKANGKPNTRKDTQLEYEKLYTGKKFRIEESYSEILKCLFICFTFGNIMPVIWLLGLGFLGFIYLTDKIMMLVTSKRPPVMDSRLNSQIRFLIQFTIPIYCIITIWNYGNKNMLEDNPSWNSLATSYYSIPKQNNEGIFAMINTFFTRAYSYHTIVFVLILVIIIVWWVQRYILLEIFAIFCACFKTGDSNQFISKITTKFQNHVPEHLIIDELALANSNKTGWWAKKNQDQKDKYTAQNQTNENDSEKWPARDHLNDKRYFEYYNIQAGQKQHESRNMQQENQHNNGAIKFSNLSSYDMRLNKKYKRFFFPIQSRQQVLGYNLNSIPAPGQSQQTDNYPDSKLNKPNVIQGRPSVVKYNQVAPTMGIGFGI